MKRIISQEEFIKENTRPVEGYIKVKNPDFIYPEFEYYPLKKPAGIPLDNITALAMDMDGTTTTTEVLCIHSLEFMLRRISGLMHRESWSGLDPSTDYANIIGNSTTRHIEYLIKKYRSLIKADLLIEAFISSAIWTIQNGKDDRRKEEVLLNLKSSHFNNFLKSTVLQDITKKNKISSPESESIAKKLSKKIPFDFLLNNDTLIVRLCIDIYYQRYHEILLHLKKGKLQKLHLEKYIGSNFHLIEPMPGISILLALVKGYLGEDISKMIDILKKEHFKKKPGDFDFPVSVDKLLKLSKRFSEKPAKVGVVTSSIFFEADIVLQEVFRYIVSEVENWPLPFRKKKKIIEKFSSYSKFYDSVVTASDSHEIRLKPHRDLYSIALHQLEIPKKDFDTVIGFEDSESGTLAIRAAGIGTCVAVPFAQTQNHNFEAAQFVLHGGIPEAILKHNLFLL